MHIGGNYPQPVYVNGFQCNNCSDVEYAKKHIDPAHPKSGPYGIHADTDPTQHHDLDPAKSAKHDGTSVTFGGALSHLNGAQAANASDTAANNTNNTPGRVLDLSA